jgi:raffinose/stachyose/melibiose transport system permease protein
VTTLSRRGRQKEAPGEPRLIAFAYIAPAFAVYAVFVLAPLLHAVYLSCFDWDGLTQGTWIGLANYARVVQDPLIQEATVHSALFIVFYTLIPISIGLFLAATLTRIRVRGMSFFRVVLFLPQTVAMVVVAVTWRWMYSPDGTINQILGLIGLGGLERGWLGDFTLALPALGFVGSWVMYGFTMILFIAGITRIPGDLYDAARVDGAGPIREFFAITLPSLRNEIQVASVFTLIAALRVFDLTYVATRGGPGHTTTVPALWVFVNAFQTGEAGYAAAIGVSLALVIVVGTMLVMRLFQRWD